MVRLALLLALTACGGGEPTYPQEWTATYAEHAANHRIIDVPYPWRLQGQIVDRSTVLTICEVDKSSFVFGACPR